MKTFNLLTISLAFGAAALLTSCQKEPQTSAVTDDGVKSIALSINFGGAATKATIDDELDDPFTATSEFQKLAILFTDNAGDIKYAFEADASDGQTTNEGKIWENLFNTASPTGVRFIGLEGVTRIYVVANGPSLTDGIDAGGLGLTFEAAGGLVTNQTAVNINAINGILNIKDYFATTKEANAMPYIGACVALELANGAVGTSAPEVVLGADAGQYYQADITIRPAVSRLEVQKISVVTEGTKYFKLAADGVALEECEEAEAEYKVHWEGFEPALVGAYMSNFYTNTSYFPTATLASWNGFETPSFDDAEGGNAPISAGLWNVATLTDEINALVSYANYNTANYNTEGASYEALVGEDYRGGESTKDANAVYVFDGMENSVNKVIPFNFFVPYDITSDADESLSALEGTIVPKLHLQLKAPGTAITTEVQKKVNDTWENLAAEDANIKTMLTTFFTWPTVAGGEDNIAFVNVKMGADVNATDEIALKPGRIYKMQEICIDPMNITGSVTSSDLNNIFVTVTVVPYVEENVYPVFD